LYEDHKPQTAFEVILIEQIASDYWRLLRIKKSEGAEIEERLAYAPLKYAQEEAGRRVLARRGEYGDFVEDSSLLNLILSPDGRKDQWVKQNGPTTEDDNKSLKLLKTTNEERERLYYSKLLRPELNPLSMRYESNLEHRILRAFITLIKIQEIRNGFVSQKPQKRPPRHDD